MSVILDALHKARGDKRNSQPEPQPHSVARVLDPATVRANVADFVPERRGANGRGWVAGIAIMFGVVCLLALIGGGFFLLYDQVRRLEAKATAAPVTAATGSVDAAVAQPVELLPPSSLPAPLPVAELPVQPPQQLAATGGPETVTASVGPANSALPVNAAAPEQLTAADFKLGSIVCEDSLCVASLNGRSVRVGDEIKGYRVVEISPSAIALKSMLGNQVINLSQYD